MFLNKKQNNLILNYNASDSYSLENGEIVRTLSTEDPKLRAYNFVVTNDVFDTNPTLKASLIEAAKKGEDLPTQGLDTLINNYANKQFNIFLTKI